MPTNVTTLESGLAIVSNTSALYIDTHKYSSHVFYAVYYNDIYLVRTVHMLITSNNQ